MTEIALYRKYRPVDFSTVIGQEHVTNVLAQAISQGNIVHAYLFSGPRGTGKTSVARILAKNLGCTDKDLYEIDGASNRGIDEIRSLREGVGTLPFESPYKVYIIDEVHMLTKDAFNALLKTLEEPPAHVIFILATTEQHKVIDTIISRCQTYVFKKPSQTVLEKVVKDIAKQEGFAIDDEVASLLAFMGDGSFRDTIGILQKIIGSSTDKKISLSEVEKITGAPAMQLIHNFVLAIAENDTDKGLLSINQALAESVDMKIFLKLAIREIRFALLLAFSPNLKAKILEEVGETEKEFLTGLSKKQFAKNLPSALKEFLSIYNEIGASFLPQALIELALLKITAGEGNK